MDLGKCGEETTLPIGIVLRLGIDKCANIQGVCWKSIWKTSVQIQRTIPEILPTYQRKLAKTNSYFLPYCLVPMSVSRNNSVDEYCISREHTLAQRVSIPELSSTKLSNQFPGGYISVVCHNSVKWQVGFSCENSHIWYHFAQEYGWIHWIENDNITKSVYYQCL